MAQGGQDVPFSDEPNVVLAVVATAIVGGLGALIGMGIDAVIRHDPEIYRRGPRVSVATMRWLVRTN